MERLYLKPTELSPEIILSPTENIFRITGRSSPEDVRVLYYPVVEWISKFILIILENKSAQYSIEKPLVFRFEFTYFNSSSAKFLYDILMDLKKLHLENVPLNIEWVYDAEDIDMKEAGMDLAILSEMEFTYIEIQH